MARSIPIHASGVYQAFKPQQFGSDGRDRPVSAFFYIYRRKQMQARLTDRPVEQVIAGIRALDLDPIKFKLMDPDEGYGWSREFADQMEVAYKRFLTLLATHPGETIVPSKNVDKFWHGHILDTLKYAEDCERVFGSFLHHFPYFGMRGAEDAANQARAIERTEQLYQREFGTGPGDHAAYCGASAAYCGSAVAGQAAYCGAAKAERSAYCGAARAESAAYCGAAISGGAAYCGAAVAAEKAAYCGAAAHEKSAYCGSAIGKQEGYCGAARAPGSLNVSERPRLPAAA
jgi:hypothetical protein